MFRHVAIGHRFTGQIPDVCQGCRQRFARAAPCFELQPGPDFFRREQAKRGGALRDIVRQFDGDRGHGWFAENSDVTYGSANVTVQLSRKQTPASIAELHQRKRHAGGSGNDQCTPAVRQISLCERIRNGKRH